MLEPSVSPEGYLQKPTKDKVEANFIQARKGNLRGFVVFVLSNTKKPLMPCTPKRARLLLGRRKAAVFRCYPFTIILKDREDGETQPLELKVDPGSKTTGLALVIHGNDKKKVAAGINLQHRGQCIKKRLDQRRAVRRSRRDRHTRYRKPRFLNRCRKDGWLPPSLMSRVHNVETWAKRIQRFSPISFCAVETVRFDMQKIQNPEISGIEYQQGELLGYEIREYLLEKWGRKCAYCGKGNVPLEVEHIQPRSRGGTNRISNLTLACRECNEKKGNQDVDEFLKNAPKVSGNLFRAAKNSLKDASAMNATRYACGNVIKSIGLPSTFWSGGRTKKNRISQGYPKDHWIDAACVGESGESVDLSNLKVKNVKATGHGDRQLCLVDRHGFPRSKASSLRVVKGFKTGDLIIAEVTKGKKTGTHFGKVAIRTNGFFNISTKNGVVQGIPYRFCRKLHSADGYWY